MYLWTYSTGAIAKNVWNVTDPSSAGYQAAGNWYGVLYCILIFELSYFWFLSLQDLNHPKENFGIALDWFSVE